MTAGLSHRSPVRFQLADADTWPNPWPMYAALRDQDPVHHVVPPEHPDHDYWVLSRHADVWEAARDNETFSSAQGLTVNYGELEIIGLQDNPPFVMQDPPVHTEFRKLVSRGFTPRQVQAVEPAVREFVVERIERLRANGGGDIVAELFKPLPSMVVAHYLGVPEADRKQFDGWTDAIVAANTTSGGITGALTTVGDAVGAMMAYVAASRRTTPSRTSSRRVSAPTATSRARCRCWRSRSRWSPAATTPPPACSVVPCSCCTSGQTSDGCWPLTRT
jgi:cytochrome P450 family 130